MKLAPGFVAGALLWGVVTACSSAVQGPTSGDAAWTGTIEGAEEPEASGPPVALSWHKGAETDTLYRVYPRTMRLRDPLRLHMRGTMGADLSASGSLLLANFRGEVRVVDRATRAVSRADTGIREVRDAAWVGEDLAILVAEGAGKTHLVRIEPSTGTVLDRASLRGTRFAFSDAGDGVVLLAHEPDAEPPAEVPPAILAVMDATGEFATVRLDAIGAGFHGEYVREFPALAVRGSVATVVGTDGTIVSVDLGTLDVTVEGKDDSLLEALVSWFVPPAHAKTFDGTELRAEWAGPDALLVSGYRNEHPESNPVGAVLLDSDDWSATVLDEDANGARVAGDHVLAWNNTMAADDVGIGLRSYGSDGELEWHAFGKQYAHPIAVHRGIAYVEHGWDRVLVSSVDVATGEVLATRVSHVYMLSL